MATLLIVHHTPSPACRELFDEVRRGASDPEITGVEVRARAALAATASDLLAADAVVLGTPANIGYMSGALKHFFDTVFYPCGEDTRGLPFGVYVHGNEGLEGAVRAVDAITAGMGWTRVAPTVEVVGAPDAAAREACWELGATVAAGISG
ncbi:MULTISPECIES: flavodoxin family protein [Pseudonocardia]|uniref:NADPH-dependent FMN reductase n=1 Tax=Pseudonocardia oroxyli TaxID=366584 RepID=A0A1G7GX97_PSEOR|nr:MULTISPECIES: NAD(P)H-dependent oxidoreductase [Pseudonocardia]MCF7553242.1 NAD(P)H-dependent oxidoreductase [Pseudonocardia sp. WMMC193]SDE92569.1 NADPH-dependent FMN reductase [Pseudonocardia oroxyli]